MKAADRMAKFPALAGLAAGCLALLPHPANAADIATAAPQAVPLISFAGLGILVGGLITYFVLSRAKSADRNTPASDAPTPRRREADHLETSIMETVRAPIIQVDGDWLILETNPCAETTLGKERDDLLGSDFRAVLNIEGDPRDEDLLTVGAGELERVFDFHVSSWRSPDGSPRRTIVLNDVTSIKQAETEIKRSEQKFRHLAESTADMIVTISPERVRTYVSPASEKVLGYKPEELVGQSPLAGIHPDDRARTFEVSESLALGGKGRIVRYRHRHKDGHYVWLEASFQAVRDDASGELVEFVGSVRDISQRAPEELAATEHNARMREANRLLEMSEALASVGHWRIDLVTGSVLWSEQVYLLHGVGRDYDPYLRGAINFYVEEDREIVTGAIQKAIETGEGFSFRARLIQPNGDIRHVHSVGQTEIAPTGETIGIFGVISDITDQVAAEAELRASRDQAQSAMKAKSAFLANMSHEIRTPMNGVIGFAGLMLEDDLEPQQRERARMILDSGEAMLELLNEILDLSKIEAGQMTIAHAPINFHDVVTSCGRMFDATASNKGLVLEVEIAPGTPRLILGDALRLRQVLSNLVGNAVKFTDCGRVSITATRDGAEVVIAVKDSGIGIAADRQQAIFEDFVQADIGITGERGGTGLGLAIVRQLVGLMGGAVTLESQPGKGSTFSVRLPFEEVDSAPSDNGGNQAEVVELRSVRDERVLLAEDNEVNCYLINEMAERMGLRLYIAGDGRRALEMVEDAIADGDPFKLVLMDLQMPEMDGLTAAKTLRGSGINARQLPIIALTANAYADDVQACLDAGMQTHLAKPVTYSQLRAEILRWMPDEDGAPEKSEQKASSDMPDLPPEIRASYENSLARLRAAIEATLVRGEPDAQAGQELARLFHSIAGMAAYFDQADKGDAASEFERAMLKAPDAQSRLAVAREAQPLFGTKLAGEARSGTE